MAAYFINPWMLAALAGFSIPIIIELIFRRRRRQVELPTIRYLLKDPAWKKVQRQDRLLLLMRCLASVLLAAALARPLLTPAGAVRNRHVILVLDATSSMGQQAGASTAFALAKNKAARLLGALPAGTKVSLITLGGKAEVRLDRSADLYAAREMVEGLKITHGAAPLVEALPALQESIDRAGQDETQELYLFSDFQKTTVLRKAADGSDPVAQMRKIGVSAPIYLVDVGGERPFNYYFTDFSPEDPLLVARRTVRFRATVEAKGTPANAEARARVTFMVNQAKQGMQEAPLQAGSATVFFDYRFPKAGEYELEVVVEGDTHRLDNHRYYLAAVPESLKVLILGETGSGDSVSPEAAFLSAAISPVEPRGLDASSIFTAKILPPGDIIQEDLANYSSVIVLGMTRVPADAALKLESFVRDGGNVLFFLSSNSNSFEYNERFFKEGKGLLPARLDRIEELAKGSMVSLKLAGATHPALTFFADETLLSGADVSRHMTLATATGVLKEGVVASFSNGKPAILETRFGRGKVVTFCTAAGPPDNFLPASPAYPILIQEMLRYLAGNPDRVVNLDIGQVFRQDVMISAQHLVVRKPDGAKVRLTPMPTGPDQLPSVSFDQTDQMGLYAVDAQADVVKRPRFIVNLQPIESDLDRIEEADARNFWPDATRVRPGAVIETVIQTDSARTELAGALLWALAGLLAAETLLAVRFGMRRQ